MVGVLAVLVDAVDNVAGAGVERPVDVPETGFEGATDNAQRAGRRRI